MAAAKKTDTPAETTKRKGAAKTAHLTPSERFVHDAPTRMRGAIEAIQKIKRLAGRPHVYEFTSDQVDAMENRLKQEVKEAIAELRRPPEAPASDIDFQF